MLKSKKIIKYYVIYIIFLLILFFLPISFNGEIVPSILAQQNTESVCSYTLSIDKDGIVYCYFYANSPITSIDLIGQYQELNGNNIMVNVYDSSSCNTSYGNPGFSIRTCTTLDSNIYYEIKPFGNIYLPLYPGEYYLTFEPGNYQDVRVSIDIYVKSYFGKNTDNNNLDNIYEDDEIESPNYGEGVESEGGCLQGPGGCGGAFDTQGFGPFSPLNPNFGQ